MKEVYMEQTDSLDRGPGALPGCEDKRSREIYPLEAPCPHCGADLEYFSDELEKRRTLRCFQCKGTIDTADYIRSIYQP